MRRKNDRQTKSGAGDLCRSAGSAGRNAKGYVAINLSTGHIGGGAMNRKVVCEEAMRDAIYEVTGMHVSDEDVATAYRKFFSGIWAHGLNVTKVPRRRNCGTVAKQLTTGTLQNGKATS
jgi:hypothetical protein